MSTNPQDVFSLPRTAIADIFDKAPMCGAQELGSRLLAGRREAFFDGINSMPLFRRFAKKFATADDAFFGHNHNGAIESLFSGPGYFCIAEASDGEAVFDYRNLPATVPNDWPEVKSNLRFPYRLVYGNMVDAVRVVSDDIFVGKAFRVPGTGPVDWSKGSSIGVHFVLVRRP